jgi:glutamyl-Q tRNA(Asp) synthetase
MRETTVQPQEILKSNALGNATTSTAAPEYRGRFAPSPTGPLHMGSLAAALASWLDARAHEGKWLIRIENIDPPRERSGAAAEQLTQLARYGMRSDEPIWFQSERFGAYESALQKLRAAGFTYYCRCTRGQLGLSLGTTTHHAYPGSCRDLGLGPPGSVRFRVDPGLIALTDRACGRFEQDVAQAVGDFVLRRSDGLWAYQLAVVLDDAAQGITDVVRGADLLDNTPRQMLLQRALGLPKPRYLHVPLVLDAAGRKLSKQDRAQALGNADRVLELEQAWQYLGFARTGAGTVLGFQDRALAQWSARFGALDPAGADAIEASLAGTRVHVAAQEPS